MTFHHTDPLLTDKEAAVILGVSLSTFRRWMNVGIVPKPLKFGRSVRWPHSEIINIIEKAKAARCTA